MEVICEVMKLKPERVRDYVELHEHTWPELIRAIRDCGFLEEYIYLLDNQVMVVMKCEDFQASVRQLAATSIYQKWTTEVRCMLVENKLIDLSPIWDLSKL